MRASDHQSRPGSAVPARCTSGGARRKAPVLIRVRQRRRLSDAGPGASRAVAMGRHLKPFPHPDSCTVAEQRRELASRHKALPVAFPVAHS